MIHHVGAACLFATVVFAGCGGHVRTVVLPAPALAPGASFTGVVFYPPQFVKLTYAYTTLVNAQGGVAGSAGKDCIQAIQKEEVKVLPDLGRPMLMQNASGFFSAARFSVTLDGGMLASVNAEPAQTPSDLVGAAATLVKEAAEFSRVVLTEPKPACNAGPRLVAFERITLQ
jgi:hypothetical protein